MPFWYLSLYSHGPVGSSAVRSSNILTVYLLRLFFMWTDVCVQICVYMCYRCACVYRCDVITQRQAWVCRGNPPVQNHWSYKHYYYKLAVFNRAKASREFWTLTAYLLKNIFWIIFNPKKLRTAALSSTYTYQQQQRQQCARTHTIMLVDSQKSFLP